MFHFKEVKKIPDLLEVEHQLARENTDVEFKSYLDRLYRLKREDVEHHFKQLVSDAYEAMADDMLQFASQQL